MKVLTGREVNRLSVDRNVQQTKGSDKSPSRPYYRAKYDGIGFTVDQSFMDSFEAGEIAEITLSEGTREINDPVTPGQKKSIGTLALGSFATRKQFINSIKFEKEVAVIENPALNNIEVTDELLAKLQAALGTKQIAG